VAAWATTGGLIVASLAAALVSIVVTPSSVSASGQLKADVLATMGASSFTMTFLFDNQAPQTIVYEAPDRTEAFLSRNGPDFIYYGGRLIYDSESLPQRKWVEQPIGQGVAYAHAMSSLAPILQARQVEESGDTFRFIRRFRDEDLHGTAVVGNGFIVSETFEITYPPGATTERIRYSRFGSSPPVTIPDSRSIVKGGKCAGGYIPPDAECGMP
jgi:hypothetical protein